MLVINDLNNFFANSLGCEVGFFFSKTGSQEKEGNIEDADKV